MGNIRRAKNTVTAKFSNYFLLEHNVFIQECMIAVKEYVFVYWFEELLPT